MNGETRGNKSIRCSSVNDVLSMEANQQNLQRITATQPVGHAYLTDARKIDQKKRSKNEGEPRVRRGGTTAFVSR